MSSEEEPEDPWVVAAWTHGFGAATTALAAGGLGVLFQSSALLGLAALEVIALASLGYLLAQRARGAVYVGLARAALSVLAAAGVEVAVLAATMRGGRWAGVLVVVAVAVSLGVGLLLVFEGLALRALRALLREE